MAASKAFVSFITSQSAQSKRAAKQQYPLHAVPLNRSRQIERQNITVTPLPLLTYVAKSAVTRKPVKLWAMAPRDLFEIDTSSDSPAQTVMLFYSAINDKNLKQLEKLIAEDCVFEDYSFSKPFEGKKEVLNFLEQLTLCMGQNMKFNVEHLWEGNDNKVGVNWHLDWNKIQVPFTRGCSNYSLSISSYKLVIKKAQVLVEPPLKLGLAALTLFKITSSIFDAFPAATEWFLKSPHIVLQMLLKAYIMAIQPIISPVLAWYIKLFNFAGLMLSIILKILFFLAKIFNM